MKTILIYLLVTFLSILSNNILAQDEFYKDKKDIEKTSVEADSISYESYSTAEDYYDAENSSVKDVKKEYAIDDVEEGETEGEKRRKRDRAAFITNVVFDVFVNAAFIFAAFLQ